LIFGEGRKGNWKDTISFKPLFGAKKRRKKRFALKILRKSLPDAGRMLARLENRLLNSHSFRQTAEGLGRRFSQDSLASILLQNFQMQDFQKKKRDIC
jgi:hypothetical protein